MWGKAIGGAELSLICSCVPGLDNISNKSTTFINNPIWGNGYPGSLSGFKHLQAPNRPGFDSRYRSSSFGLFALKCHLFNMKRVSFSHHVLSFFFLLYSSVSYSVHLVAVGSDGSSPADNIRTQYPDGRFDWGKMNHPLSHAKGSNARVGIDTRGRRRNSLPKIALSVFRPRASCQ